MPDSVASILGIDGLPAAADPLASAVVWREGSYSYAELRDRAVRIAGSLRESGLVDGDRVLTQLRNRGEILALYFACAYAGLTYVPVNFRLGPAELDQVIADCGPAFVFTQEGLPQDTSASLAEFARQGRLVVLAEDAPGADFERLTSAPPLTEPWATDIQLILYTSGTTGQSKGVVLRHSTVLAYALQQGAVYRAFDDTTVTLLPGPMSNAAAIHDLSIPTLLVGGTVACMPSGGWTAERMFAAIDDWGVTHSIVFPSMMRDLLVAQSSELESMRFVVVGGEYCPPDLMARFEEAWPHIELMVAYGSTESGLVSYLSSAERALRPESLGRAAPMHRIEIRDFSGARCEVDRVGEIWTTGPGVAAGYWDAAGLTAEYFEDDWVKIGDLGRLDQEGYFYLSGRSKDMIISKAQNIYPAEIEVVLNRAEEVRESVVFGVADEAYGEMVCAAVVPADGEDVDPASLREWARASLAGYKLPRRILVLGSLPRNQTGKVLKDELRRIAEGEEEPSPMRRA